MKKSLPLYALLGIILLASACGAKPSAPTAVPAAGSQTAEAPATSEIPTATPDLCSQENRGESVKIVNTYVHQFDNYAALATTVGPAQLKQLLTTMQAIRATAQLQPVPPCLTDLKHYALLYMDTVIQTLVEFQTKPDIKTLNAGILQARQYNDQYAAELARLLGVTLEPNATTAAQAGTPAGVASTRVVPMVLNPGPNPLNLHVSPSLTSQAVGVLNASETATAVGKSQGDEWIQIEVPGEPGKLAWVYASLVQYVSGDTNMLPVATP
jgi:SH3 domain-containing protein